MAKKKSRKAKASTVRTISLPSPSVSGDSKVWAFISIFFGLVGFVLALLFKRKDRYAMYYAKQSLVLCVIALVLPVALGITIIGAVLIPVAWVLIIVWWVLGIIYSLSGKQRPLPVIGRFAEKLDF